MLGTQREALRRGKPRLGLAGALLVEGVFEWAHHAKQMASLRQRARYDHQGAGEQEEKPESAPWPGWKTRKTYTSQPNVTNTSTGGVPAISI